MAWGVMVIIRWMGLDGNLQGAYREGFLERSSLPGLIPVKLAVDTLGEQAVGVGGTVQMYTQLVFRRREAKVVGNVSLCV